MHIVADLRVVLVGLLEIGIITSVPVMEKVSEILFQYTQNSKTKWGYPPDCPIFNLKDLNGFYSVPKMLHEIQQVCHTLPPSGRLSNLFRLACPNFSSTSKISSQCSSSLALSVHGLAIQPVLHTPCIYQVSNPYVLTYYTHR